MRISTTDSAVARARSFESFSGISIMRAPIAWIADAVRSSKDFGYIRTVNGMFYDIELYLYTSHETGMTYIVKVYTNHVVDADVIGSLSFNHGIIRKGFHGEAL